MVLLALSVSAPAAAQNLYAPEPMASVVDELRIGLHFHDVHGTMLPFSVGQWRLDQLEDMSFDVLFHSPDLAAFRWIGSPRPEIGATVSFDDQDSMIHAGLTWQLPILDTPAYLEGTLGVALNNGMVLGAPAGRKNFGCHLNFYERFGIGTHLTDNVTATITYEHTSNNGWCQANDGLSNFGLRMGWKF
jgi:hypothetical protein